MHAGRKHACSSYHEQSIAEQHAAIGVMDAHGGGRRVIVSVTSSSAPADHWTHPANYWADIQRDADVAEVVRVAFAHAARDAP
jgi:hypothetical protein